MVRDTKRAVRVLMLRFSVAVMTMVLLAACAHQDIDIGQEADEIVTARMILESSPLGDGGAGQDVSRVDMLELSPEMIAFLEEEIDIVRDKRGMLTRLGWAVIKSGKFELSYDESTQTATETFESRKGNCLSFTNMFIAMARHLGINAYFQEVNLPPVWSLSGQSYIFNQHINVYARLDQGFDQVIDFNQFEIDLDHDTRLISDDRARAHYHNNIGVEQMLAGDPLLAYLNLKESLLRDGTYAPAWINMGILHRRQGLYRWAEAAYLEALELEPGNLMALSNLTSLYRAQGMEGLSERYMEKVQRHRMQNPYYRFHKANAAFSQGDYDTAIKDLKYAIRHQRDEDRFCYLLSLSYLMNGDREAALKWMEKAESLAQEKSTREKYSLKLEMLQNLSQH